MTDRALVRALATERPPRTYGRCGFCGAPCYGPTCRHHRELLALDVNTPAGVAAAVRESTTPEE